MRFSIIVPVIGSPPRMRERHVKFAIALRGHGITPAYAGKTTFSLFCSFLNEDHPRVCGKDSHHTCVSRLHMGSPPRMRERRTISVDSRNRDRITPAYAGKTVGQIPHSKVVEDHPRVCGKDITSVVAEFGI